MEVGDFKGTKKPHKITVRGKHLNPRRVKAEPLPQKSFDDCGDTMQEWIRKSRDLKSEDISREYEQTTQFNATSSWIQNKQATEVADDCKVDAGSEEEEEDISEPDVQAEEEPTKRRTSSENSVQGSRIFEQETYAQLEADIKKLQKDNNMSCHNMHEISESCAQLRRENRCLLKQLKKVCTPDTIAYLEAKNPDKKVDNLGSS